MKQKIPKTEEEWKKKLSPEQYKILRQKSTEIPFTGKYWNHKEKGIYYCAGCGSQLFSSDAKFESGTGWPSFFQPLKKENVEEKNDSSLFVKRTEVLCKKCKSHLGHIFPDGPAPTGARYCINSACLNFKKIKGK